MAERWFFYDPESGRFVAVIENPKAHTGYREMGRKYNRDGCVTAEYPIVILNGREVWGSRLQATQNDNIACTSSCKTAKEPACSCSCGGKNHGVAWQKEQAEEIES